MIPRGKEKRHVPVVCLYDDGCRGNQLISQKFKIIKIKANAVESWFAVRFEKRIAQMIKIAEKGN